MAVNSMSGLRINIPDANRSINGAFHGSMADAILARLTAEPDTIEELDAYVRSQRQSSRAEFIRRNCTTSESLRPSLEHKSHPCSSAKGVLGPQRNLVAESRF
jgi:hypothetical protein